MSIRTQYDSDLEALKAALAEMGRSSADAVEDALEALGEITGKCMREEITNQIFSRFCVGK